MQGARALECSVVLVGLEGPTGARVLQEPELLCPRLQTREEVVCAEYRVAKREVATASIKTVTAGQRQQKLWMSEGASPLVDATMSPLFIET